MSSFLMKILFWALALDVFALGLLLVFMINARMNLRREITEARYYFKAIALAQMTSSSDEAAERMGIPLDDFKKFCALKDIEPPERRTSRIKAEHEAEEEEQQRLMAEEAAWRGEQERIIEERKKASEEEARTRKERLRKFGFS